MVANIESGSTEDKIIIAARKIFMQKGLAGARMQDIANEAKINKAMLHYYFRNKKKLFEIIFDEQLNTLLKAYSIIFASEKDLEEKLEALIKKKFEILSDFPELPLFVLHEAQSDPQLISRHLEGKNAEALLSFFERSVQRAIDQGQIKAIDARQLLINVISTSIYPFIASPIFKPILGFSEDEYHKMMQDRPKMLTKFIWNSIKINSNS